MNKTRIKVVSDCEETKYYCQYSIVWFLAWEPMHVNIHEDAIFDTEQEAKDFIDEWILRQEQYRKESEERAAKRKEKKRTTKIEYIDYP